MWYKHLRSLDSFRHDPPIYPLYLEHTPPPTLFSYSSPDIALRQYRESFHGRPKPLVHLGSVQSFGFRGLTSAAALMGVSEMRDPCMASLLQSIDASELES